MECDLLTPRQAAQRLGVTAATVYSWLAESNAGTFMLHGRPVTIAYFQTGRNGRGRIRIEATEIDRIMELMQVCPRPTARLSFPVREVQFPGIIVKLGRPN